MSVDVENFIALMHADPASLPGAPTNAEIIGSGDALMKKIGRDLTPGERQGFLEMWQTGMAATSIAELSPADLRAVQASTASELTASGDTEQRIRDLRFLNNAAAHALNTAKK